MKNKKFVAIATENGKNFVIEIGSMGACQERIYNCLSVDGCDYRHEDFFYLWLEEQIKENGIRGIDLNDLKAELAKVGFWFKGKEQVNFDERNFSLPNGNSYFIKPAEELDPAIRCGDYLDENLNLIEEEEEETDED